MPARPFPWKDRPQGYRPFQLAHPFLRLDAKLGPEEITRDIPNVSENAVRNLDSRGIIMVGAEVAEGDILVGKVTPKGHPAILSPSEILRF